jgi:hypothetical protein
VIVVGQPQGGTLAWKSLDKHLLSPFNAHLATYFTKSSANSILQNMAHFNWIADDNLDLGVYFDAASELCFRSKKTWPQLCNVNNKWLGGITACNQTGSSGMWLAFSWLVSQKILELSLFKQYDYFVLTRSEHVYLCKHAAFSTLDNRFGYYSRGENRANISDRHLVASAQVFLKLVNLTQELSCNTQKWMHLLRVGSPDVGIEAVQKMMWQQLKVDMEPLLRSHFSVQKPNVPPFQVSHGVQKRILQKFDLEIPYPLELDLAMNDCSIDEADLVQTLDQIASHKISFIHPRRVPPVFVTAKLNLWQDSENGYLGNQMFIFQSVVGIARKNRIVPVFQRSQLKMLNSTFDLTRILHLYKVVDSWHPSDFPTQYNLDSSTVDIPVIKSNSLLSTYLQNSLFFQPLNTNPRSFWVFRESVLSQAKSILPEGRLIGVHIRRFSSGGDCPTAQHLQHHIHKIFRPGMCVIVFSNDIVSVKRQLTAPCIKFIDPGDTVTVAVHGNEVHPISNANRDFAALTLCEDLVVTCGTFGYLASTLHSGNGSVYFFGNGFSSFGVPNAWYRY